MSGGSKGGTGEASGIERLRKRIDATLEFEKRSRGLSTDVNGAWQIFHGILAYGHEFEIDTPEGRVAAIEYFSSGGSCDGFQPRIGSPFAGTEANEVRQGLIVDIQPTTKTGQGHRDQWLAVVAQAGVPPDQQWNVGGETFSTMDWLRQAEFDVPLNYEEEFSWTIIPLAYYRPTSYEWTARDGQTYSTELLLEVEVLKDLEASVCGGTHRLIGIANILKKRIAEGAAMTRVWSEAKSRLESAVELARSNQNADGSYGPWYLHRTGWCHDLGEMLGTTGHVLEFLATAGDDATVRAEWVQRTANRLCGILDECRKVNLECGVLYHALHGLVEYRRRIA